MHEYSIVQSLYDAVAAQAAARGATSVHALRVRIGEMSGVDPGLLETAWKTFRVRTICESAPLDVEIVAAQWQCSLCGAPVARGSVLSCTACGAPAKLKQGDEILLDRIVMEVP
jgi:hydrogenase nickel incorporation protein HypA/HybF